MSRPPNRDQLSPLKRAAAELIARFQNGAYAVSQPFLLVDPPGYGAVRVLDDFARALQDAPASVAGFRVGSLPDRPDAIDGLPALLVEIAAIASADAGDLQMWRRRVLDWQRDRDPAGFRTEIDRYLAEIFSRTRRDSMRAADRPNAKHSWQPRPMRGLAVSWIRQQLPDPNRGNGSLPLVNYGR